MKKYYGIQNKTADYRIRKTLQQITQERGGYFTRTDLQEMIIRRPELAMLKDYMHLLPKGD